MAWMISQPVRQTLRGTRTRQPRQPRRLAPNPLCPAGLRDGFICGAGAGSSPGAPGVAPCHCLVNAAALVECVYDTGSEVDSISKKKAYELGIPYDEREQLKMTSASGTRSKTVGIAKNIPIELQGGITVYLQLHIVRTDAYDVLLGRPFESLLTVGARNSPDGRHELVITCPNTAECLTIRTYARGDSPPDAEPPVGFRSSRI